MDLTERKKKILRAVVESYIRTAEPVGSKAILELADLKVSSATIRNELSDLTEMGYLEQPHTSAGRVPSPKGYRLYVNELMEEQRLSLEETKQINDALHLKMQELDKVIDQAGRMVSQLTNYPAFALAGNARKVTIRRFDLILHNSCRCSCSPGINKCKCTVIPYFTHHSQSILKIFFRFRRKAHHNVGSQLTIGNIFVQKFDLFQIFGRRIFSVHQPKNPIGTRLHRQMDQMTDLLVFSDRADELFPEIFRITRHETKAEFFSSLADLAQKRRKGKFSPDVVTV